ncbi:MAG: hypothetical protein EX258_03970 [Sphingomonadaceae bacterium]|nr:MAG: hypothetical protein EX258_03970 [Sphingomonadaceae bacterium]
MSEWLLDTLLVTTALMLLVLAIRRPVAEAFGAQVAYMLWLIPGARMLMPVLTETVERPAAAVGAMPDIGASPSAVLMATATAPAEPVMPPLATEVAAAPGLLESQVAAIGGAPGVLLLAWAMGAAGFFAGRLFIYARERADIMDKAERVATLGKVRLVRSPAVTGPVAFGIVDKVIALPIDFDDNFTTREQELALDHELAHHRSGDLIANLAAFAVLSIHWFNPVAWAAWRAFRFDQEAACDARVIGTITSGDRVTYGRAIAKAASGRATLFAAALDDPENLKRRLKTMTFRKNKMLRHAGTAAIAATLVVGLPLTATKAVEYVDRPAAPAAPAAATAPAAPTAVIAPNAPAAPVAPAAPLAPTAPILIEGVPTPVIAPRAPRPPRAPMVPVAANSWTAHPHTISNDGKTNEWKDLTPEEKAEVRAELAEAKREMREAIRELRQERREIRSAQSDTRRELLVDREEMRRDLDEARREIRLELRNLDRSGGDPEKVRIQKIALTEALHNLENMDMEKVINEAMASVDWDQIDAQMARAEADMERAIAKMDAYAQD